MLSWSPAVDPYQALGVARDASEQAIKQAYRRIALETHPDRNGNDPTAAERFRRATQCYELLRDPKRKLLFDSTGRWEDDGWGAGGLDVQLAEALEIFARDFGAGLDFGIDPDHSPAHTARTTIALDVSYEEVENGGRRRLAAPCVLCAGSGAEEGSTHVRCTSCGGSGRLRHVETSVLGPKIHTEKCDGCHGSGRRPLLVCRGCNGSGLAQNGASIEVMIPRGTGEGDTLPTVAPSTARFVARLAEDPRWARDGADLYAVGRVPYAVAVLGGALEVELPGRKHCLEVTAGTASGHRIRVPGQGLPRRTAEGRGSLILTLHVAVPERVGSFERLLLRARRASARPPRGGGVFGALAEAQASSASTARRLWSQWRAHQHQSSLSRIENAAESLRAAAGYVSESEQRLGPMLERAFPMIAPEAAMARRRLDGGAAPIPTRVLADFAVDALIVLTLAIALWVGAFYARPAIDAAGVSGFWGLMRSIHPAFYGLVPLFAGFWGGALAAGEQDRLLNRFVPAFLWVLVAAAAVATAAAMYAAGSYLAPGTSPMLGSALSAALAIAVGSMPVILFQQVVSLVGRGRAAAEEFVERSNLRALRKYDRVATRLSESLQGTEQAFRFLLTASNDARHPLTSLLDEAAQALAGDRVHRIRTTDGDAAAALARSVLFTILWLAATALAVGSAYGAAAPGSGIVGAVALGVSVGALCSLGPLLPPLMMGRPRSASFLAGLLTGCASLALIGYSLTSGTDPSGWVAALAVVAALALSFGLADAARATWIAIRIAAAGTVAALLWPVRLANSTRGSSATAPFRASPSPARGR